MPSRGLEIPYFGGTYQGVVTFTNATTSTSPTTGALVVTGGLGVGGPVNFAGGLTLNGNLLNSGALMQLGSAGGGGVQFRLQSAAGNNRQVAWYSAGTMRWSVTADNTAETGGDAGTFWSLTAYNDAGAQIDNPLRIGRSAGSPAVFSRTVITPEYTVATLPSAAVSNQRAMVTDALAPVFGAAVAGGGAVRVPVYSDAGTWRVG